MVRLIRAGLACAGAILLLFGGAAPAGAAVSISAPTSAQMGTAPIGATRLSAQLGTVTVTASGLVAPSFTATVSASVFTTGAGTASETIGKSSLRYWSGPATASSGVTVIPGQLTELNAVSLTVSRTAFSGTGLTLSISASWNPTLIVDLPASAVAGAYTGIVTHSVA